METILLLAQQRKPAQEPLSKVNPYLLAALLGGAVVVTAVLHFASPPQAFGHGWRGGGGHLSC